MKKIPENSILKKEFTIPFFNMKNIKKIFKSINNRKKTNIYKRKRKTFRGIFAKNALIGLFLTVIFAGGLFIIGKKYICSQLNSYTSHLTSYVQQLISKYTTENDPGPQTLSSYMRSGAYFNIVLDDYNAKYQIISGLTEDCHTFIRLTDKDGNITHSSRMGLQTFVIFGEGDKEYLFCDTENKDFPKLQQLEEDYKEMFENTTYLCNKYIKKNYSVYAETVIKSAYVNREEGLFIPHETELNLIKYHIENAEPDEILESKSYTIDMPEKDGYELMEFSMTDRNRMEKSEDFVYPRIFTYSFCGTDKKVFDRINSENPANTGAIIGMSGASGGRVCYQNVPTYIDGEPYTLTVLLQVSTWNSVTKPLYFKLVIIFLIAMLVIALIDAWRRNVKNQADYMFEDYQTNLTNSLAHDLKTPLMAMSGYIENILTGNLDDEKINKYLSAVMDNISYTDSIISRTLELNAINHINIKRENISLYELINETVEKYSMLLDERNISVTTDGTGEISADISMLKTIIENLISNAVNYTTENGKINISISNKNIVIKNTVDNKVDVKELKKPFAKDDKSRRNNSGSGLGLAIAENATAINGFKLDISCSNTEFIAELKFRI